MKILAPNRIPEFYTVRRNYPLDCVLACFIHGLWRKSRGKQLSAQLHIEVPMGLWWHPLHHELNPRRAFAVSRDILYELTSTLRFSFRSPQAQKQVPGGSTVSGVVEEISERLCVGGPGDLPTYLQCNYAPWRQAVIKHFC
jgi:hypothetical protein